MPRGRLLLFGVRALIAAAIAAPFWFWKGGVLELEVPSLAYQEVPREQLLQALTPYRQAAELLSESVTLPWGARRCGCRARCSR